LVTVTQADEIVKARLASAEEARLARETRERLDMIESGTRYLVETIPRLKARLEELDYPDAELVSVQVAGPLRLFGRRNQTSVQMAGWLVWSDRYSEGHSELYLLSDGHLKSSGWSSQSGWSSGPIDVSQIPIDYSEKGAVELLEHARVGVSQLVARYGAASHGP
jgi:hypothetical protein